jgi:hypothetical protein
MIVFILTARPTGRCFGTKSKRRCPLNGRGNLYLGVPLGSRPGAKIGRTAAIIFARTSAEDLA